MGTPRAAVTWHPQEWVVGEARVQIRVRARNKLTRNAMMRLAPESGSLSRYDCECGDPSCKEGVAVTSREFDELRRDPAMFLVRLHHENPELSVVIRERPGYAVVAPLPGRLDRFVRAASDTGSA